MPIFGRQKDRELIKHFSKEVMQSIIDTPVIVYKPYVSTTNVNLYGEGVNGDKNYRAGITIHATINREDQEWTTTDLGVDITQKGTFTFLNEDIWNVAVTTGNTEENGFAIEIGDIIYYDTQYWEIDSTNKNQYLHGRNQNVMAGDGADFGFSNEAEMHGESLSTVVQAHITRKSRINIEEPTQTTTDGNSPNSAHGLYR
tara:strand:+ start:2447 stop:3046 length:600 start_codon:yes stop_codon:yes gene_type:complete